MTMVRSLARVPAFSATVIITFAIATAVVAATFALVWHIVVDAPPYAEPDRLRRVYGHYGAETPQHSSVSPPDFADRRNARSFESAAVWMPSGVNLTDGDPERLMSARVSPGFFDVLGVRNRFTSGSPGTAKETVVLSERVWRRRFGARTDLVGTAIRLNGVPHTVTGIAPERFSFPDRDIDAWIPLELTATTFADDQRGNEYLHMIARLKRGVSAQQAQAEMEIITASVLNRVPDRTQFLQETKWGVDVVSLRDDLVGRHGSALLLLFGAAVLVLLLVTANVAGLFVARTIARQKEIAVRAALGAARPEIARALAAEVGTLALLGMLAGLALARLAIPFIAATGLPRAEEVRVDGIVIAFTILAVAIVTAVIAAIISAYGARPVSLMANDRGGTGTPRAARLRALLVGTQVAIAVMLLAGGVLLVESYRRLRGVEAGFDPSNVLTFRIALPNAKYPEARQRRAFFDELQQKLTTTPGVVAMSAISELPLSSDDWTATFNIDGYARSLGLPSGHIRIIMPGYTNVMRIPLLRGRMFDARDSADAPKVVVIDEMMARRYWPNQDPIGKRMTFSDDLSKATWREVVGVIGAVHHASLDVAAEPHLYLPAGQSSSFTGLYGVLRTRGNAERVAADLRSVVRSIDPIQPVFAIRTMEQYLDDATSQPRLRATILALFAGIGVLLALLGLYALLSYISIARTREIGLRMALGATQPEIVRFITVWAARITGFGVIAGLAGALAMMRSMRAMLFGVEQLQFQALAAVALGFIVVAMLASALPALRAARVDPAVALRHD